MKLAAAAAVTLALAATSRLNAQCTSPDPTNALLCIYSLSASEESAFSATDGQLSSFWYNWSGRDYRTMVPPDDCYPGRCHFTGGASDAAVTVRAAGSASGLYLSFVVDDDDWVTRLSSEDYGADALDFYIDHLDANTVFTCTDCWIGYYNTTLTYSSHNFKVWLGDLVSDAIRYEHYDENLWSWQAVTLSPDVAQAVYGALFEKISIDAGTRAFEIFVPWDMLDFATTPPSETKLAFVPGYNDRDGAIRDTSMLRWLGKDPWGADAQTVNYWGDLEVGTGLVEPAIGVTSPNGGENWLQGSQHNITWTSTGAIPNVSIEYSANGGGSFTQIAASTPNDGSYLWTLPAVASTNCIVRIGDATDNDPTDMSNAPFTISPPPTVTLTSPNGGETWEAGGVRSITWSATGSLGNLRIEYSVTNGSTWSLIAASAANTGSYSWTIPNTPSNHCRVRITDVATGSISDISHAAFTITPAPALTVLSPNSGESWEVGSTHDITWSVQGTVGDVRIEYSTDNGQSWSQIVSSTTNDGSWGWTVPSSVSSVCRIRISEASDGNPVDVSDAAFTIYAPSVTLVSPNGGETWQEGTEHAVTWTTTGSVSNVHLEYSANAGGEWHDIVLSTPNDGSYTWTVPATASTTCYVRISEAADGAPADQSDATFTITAAPVPAAITVTAPNGGETLAVGSQVSVTWSTQGAVGDVSIEYSSDNGDSWAEVIGGTANDGLHSWTVPNDVSTNCIIRVTDAANTAVTDMSDAPFTIEPAATIIVSYPNGGQALMVGETRDITWAVAGTVGEVAIEYSINDGANWIVIADSETNDGSYSWTIPDNPSQQCRLRISEAIDGNPSDISDAAFTITAIPEVAVTWPNGGETLIIGEQISLTWASAGAVGDVKIEYSVDSGGTWSLIAPSTGNDGSFGWTVPQVESKRCLLRIVEASHGEPGDTSDGAFTIEPAPAITLTAPNGGENWALGSTQQITWTTQGTVGPIKIELSTNNGADWNTLHAAYPSDSSSYAWELPMLTSQSCLIRVTEAADDDPSDESDAIFSIEAPVDIGPDARTAPTVTQVTAVAPNPVRGMLAVNYALAENRHVSVRIYSASGKLIRVLENRAKDSGYHSVAWDRRDRHGAMASDGLYVVRIQLGEKRLDRCVMVLR